MWRVFVLIFAVFSGSLSRSIEEQQPSDLLHVVDLNETVIDDAPPADPTAAGERIVGGWTTNIQSYPYTVQVLQSNQMSCGGSLITTRMAMSAAHCFFDTNNILLNANLFSIRAGTSVLNSGGLTRNVRRVIPHERYNNPVRDNDIAILVLQSAVTLSASIGLAAIPAQGNWVPDNVSVTAVGWGRTNPNINALSTTLQEVTVYTINQNTCVNNYNSLGLYLGMPAAFPVTTNMICAGMLGVGGRDACTGDSGGPLIYNGIVVGITSWGYSCGEPYYPGVSARVASYTTWINATVTANNVGTIRASTVILLVSLISASLR